MRLNDSEISAINSLARKHFGDDVKVILFGSRSDDNQRGGDIDLFIYKTDGARITVRRKIEFITSLLFQIGEQRVDVVLDRPELRNTLFYQTILKKGIPLC
jgi:predicted nucleotidyltransferase